jgi:hypothetical protein
LKKFIQSCTRVYNNKMFTSKCNLLYFNATFWVNIVLHGMIDSKDSVYFSVKHSCCGHDCTFIAEFCNLVMYQLSSSHFAKYSKELTEKQL